MLKPGGNFYFHVRKTLRKITGNGSDKIVRFLRNADGFLQNTFPWIYELRILCIIKMRESTLPGFTTCT